VKVCLAKDPDERFQSVHDLKLQLIGLSKEDRRRGFLRQWQRAGRIAS
jgi:hypothetical protein